MIPTADRGPVLEPFETQAGLDAISAEPVTGEAHPSKIKGQAPTQSTEDRAPPAGILEFAEPRRGYKADVEPVDLAMEPESEGLVFESHDEMTPPGFDSFEALEASPLDDANGAPAEALVQEPEPPFPAWPTSGERPDDWLWVDARPSGGAGTGAMDLTSSVKWAIERFQSKPWTGGRSPGRLQVHPDLLACGVEAVAEALGLVVLTDPRVTPGTFWLGLVADGPPGP